MQAAPPPADAGGDEPAPVDYRSVLKEEGSGPFISPVIPLGQGRMRLTIWVTRTTGTHMRAQYRRAGGSTVTWWSTSNAVNGQTRTIEVPVNAATSYRYYVVCDPPAAWSLRVQWKP